MQQIPNNRRGFHDACESDLLSFPFFAQADDAEISLLTKNSFVYQCPGVESDFRHINDNDAQVYFLIKGTAFLCSLVGKKKKILRVYFKGDCVRQSSFFSHKLNLVTQKYAKIISMSAQIFQDYCDKNSRAMRIYCTYLEKLESERLILNQIVTMGSEQRLISFLRMHTKVNAMGVLQFSLGPVSHEQIALSINLSRETVTRILGKQNENWARLIRDGSVHVSKNDMEKMGLV